MNIAQAQTKMPRGRGAINIDLSKGLNTKEYNKKVKEKVRSLDSKSMKREVRDKASSVV